MSWSKQIRRWDAQLDQFDYIFFMAKAPASHTEHGEGSLMQVGLIIIIIIKKQTAVNAQNLMGL